MSDRTRLFVVAAVSGFLVLAGIEVGSIVAGNAHNDAFQSSSLSQHQQIVVATACLVAHLPQCRLEIVTQTVVSPAPYPVTTTVVVTTPSPVPGPRVTLRPSPTPVPVLVPTPVVRAPTPAPCGGLFEPRCAP